MAYIVAGQFAMVIGLVWLLHHTHRQEVANAIVVADQHARERADHLERLDRLVASLGEQRGQPHPDLRELVGIVDRLCQRVQAPDAAVTEHAIAQPLPPMPQPPLTDAGWWESQGFTVPKEDLANALDG